MSSTVSDSEQADKQCWVMPRISAIEADIAFFDARLSLIGDPKTSYRKAEQRAYLCLLDCLKATLSRLRVKRPDPVPDTLSGIVVQEIMPGRRFP